MKTLYRSAAFLRYIALAGIAIPMGACSDADSAVGFSLDLSEVHAEAVGGRHTVRVSSDEEWIASVSADNTWITVTPANGRGSTDCVLQIDSALTHAPRSGKVRIQNQNSLEYREITVTQEGFDYAITPEKSTVEIPDYAVYGTRHFDVRVRSNVPFSVHIEDKDRNALSCEPFTLRLNGGLRPRETTLRFNWGINSLPKARPMQVKLQPDNADLAEAVVLTVDQAAGPEIEADTRRGDSVALLSIARTIGLGNSWEQGDPMDRWQNVSLWEENMEGWTAEKDGRVRSVQFFMFNTKEPIPYAIQYLTAAEEIIFYGNSNTFLIDQLEPGEDIVKLKDNLKRLTLYGYGFTEFPAYMAELSNLEYLDLTANQFQRIPSVLKDEANFPKLRELVLNANQRYLVSDLSNTLLTNLGGFIEEPSFPTELLLRRNLESLLLSVNFLQGSIPDFLDDPSVPTYTQADVDASYDAKRQCDTLPAGNFADNRRGIIGLKKVAPQMKHLALNLNRFTGALPDWLLYHPSLDLWIPDIIIFNQEGFDQQGRKAGFSNTPPNLNYYYDFYTAKARPSDDYEREE